ncbi:major capsid family protein [Cupriavidus basilensis]
MSELKHLQRRATADAVRKVARHFTRDGMMTYDQTTIDSTGAFLVGQLERLDQTLNEPLVEYTWSRDIELRTDVSAADEVASFTNSTFAAAGGIRPGGLNWISNEGNALPGPSVDIGKTGQPMRLWGQEVKYTVPELIKSQKLGMPIDAQKVEAMNLKRNMDIDQIVYVGDPDMSFTGLINLGGRRGQCHQCVERRQRHAAVGNQDGR